MEIVIVIFTYQNQAKAPLCLPAPPTDVGGSARRSSERETTSTWRLPALQAHTAQQQPQPRQGDHDDDDDGDDDDGDDE